MCRLVAYLGSPVCVADLVTRPSRSLLRQSFDSRERMKIRSQNPSEAYQAAYLNGDGFGVGWYGEGTLDLKDGKGQPIQLDVRPCTFLSLKPAWSDINLNRIAQTIVSKLIFAHVRAAGPGMPISESLCHPFLCGRYMFMHNGMVAGFSTIRRELISLLDDFAFNWFINEGCTDSTLAFAMFLTYLRGDAYTQHPPQWIHARLVDVIRTIGRVSDAHGIPDCSALNLVISDGKTLIAARYAHEPPGHRPVAPASLYFACGSQFVCGPDNQYRIVHSDRRCNLAILTSEPLTDKLSDWMMVPKNNCVIITESSHVLMSEISREAGACDKELQQALDALLNGKSLQPINDAGGHVGCEVAHGTLEIPLAVASPKDVPQIACQHALADKHELPTVVDSVLSLALVSNMFSETHNHELLFCGANSGRISIWDTTSKTWMGNLAAHECAVLCMVVSESSARLYSGGADRYIRVWDLSKCSSRDSSNQVIGVEFASQITCIRHLKFDRGDILSLCLHDRFLFLGFQSTEIFRVYTSDLEEDGAVVPQEGACPLNALVLPEKHCGFVLCLATWGDYVCSAGGDASIKVWSTTITQSTVPAVERVSLPEHPMHPDQIPTAACSTTPAPEPVNSCKDLYTDRMEHVLTGHSGAVYALAAMEVAPLSLFSGSGDRTIRIWDIDSFACRYTMMGHDDAVLSLVIVGTSLLSGSADGYIFMWNLETYEKTAILCPSLHTSHLHTFDEAAVISLAARAGDVPIVYSGSSDGAIRIWSIDSSAFEPDNVSMSGTLSRTVSTSELDIENGQGDEILPTISLNRRAAAVATGVSPMKMITTPTTFLTPEHKAVYDALRALQFENLLRKFIAFQSYAGRTKDCWDCAKFLSNYLQSVLGASVRVVNLAEGRNPVILGRVKANALQSSRKLSVHDLSSGGGGTAAAIGAPLVPRRPIVFYGHYDVVAPGPLESWKTDPFTLSGHNDYYYGRGTTDNKGPILAVIMAIKSLKDEGRLPVDVVFCIEGEEESSSAGFREAIDENRGWIFGYGSGVTPFTSVPGSPECNSISTASSNVHNQNVSGLLSAKIPLTPSTAPAVSPNDSVAGIVICNSYWVADNRPCLVYGMRGVIDLEVQITGPSKCLHSGVDGGVICEPFSDMVAVLGSLVNAQGRIQIPGFYDSVRPAELYEDTFYEAVGLDVDEYKKSLGVDGLQCGEDAQRILEARWREPVLSVTGIRTTPDAELSIRLIPNSVTGKVTIRYVPDQNAEDLIAKFSQHIESEFAKRNSHNKLQPVKTLTVGDWWLGDHTTPIFQAASRAIEAEWNVKPLYVREGGTMPITRFLETSLKANALHLPIGQRSDAAHLPNERISVKNLHSGVAIVRRMLLDPVWSF